MLESTQTHSRPPDTERIRPVRRVVSGHNSAGRSIIAQDNEVPFVTTVGHPDFGITDVWHCEKFPADNSNNREPCSNTIELEPPATGNLVRIVQFPPDEGFVDKADAHDVFRQVGTSGEAAMSTEQDKPHPLMHRTDTIDYIVVISGEIYAVLDEEETLLQAGDVFIQRGTNHAWSNRSNSPCFIVAVLNGAGSLNLNGD